jgi:hypothetical protein
MTPKRDDAGKFTKQYPDEAFLEAVATLDTPTTMNISEEVGCSYDLVYRKLREFEQEGKVESLKVGSSLLWSMSGK